jgi:hypothetical protein
MVVELEAHGARDIQVKDHGSLRPSQRPELPMLLRSSIETYRGIHHTRATTKLLALTFVRNESKIP